MKRYISIIAAFLITACPALSAPAISPAGINLSTVLTPERFSNSIQLLVTLSLITLAPFFLISVTSFLRMIIVLGLIRVAVGTQQVPPNSVIIGLSLFMTVFVMTPVWQEINTKAIVPYNQKKISQAKAFEVGIEPVSYTHLTLPTILRV